MRFKTITSTLLLFSLALLAAGCNSLYTNTATPINPGSAPMIPYFTPTPAPRGTPAVDGTPATNGNQQSYPMIPYSGTSVISGGQAVSSGFTSNGDTVTPPANVTPLTPDSSGNLDVTTADNGRTVLLQVGQRFLLDLGETYTWNFTINDQTIVSRVPNIMTIRGSQGLFEAHAAGTTTLQATGDPACRQSQPACMMPSVNFSITITVK